MPLTVGSRLGPYEILGKIGAGGMGEVYRARDTRLRRDVAIKVLPETVAADPERLARFEHEARAVAALSHPNVLAIHDVGREGGVSFAVLELLEGETLGRRLSSGPIPWRDALEIATPIAEALAAAHAAGLVHRDLKPDNVFLTADGRVKVLDFGLARRLEPVESDATSAPTRTALTEPGSVMGTPAYLSPEQARGEKVDGRSDVFAFGCVLHEMLAGRPAFGRDTAADTMVAILRDEPPSLGTAVPASIAAIVRRCLRKNAAERFASAGELAAALRAARRESAAAGETGERRRSIAVLPFKSLGGGADADLGLALADATITELALVHSLLVRPTAAILRYRDRAADPEEAARELGVEAVVDGSVQSSGGRLRVTVQLVDAGGGPLWGTKIDASLGDVFAMQDEVSRKIVDALRVRLSPSDERRLAAAAPPAPAAHELYLKGRIHLFAETRLDELNAAITCFEEARRLDPESPLAMVGLADAWARMGFAFDPEGGWWERAEALTEQALALAPDLPEGRYLRGRMLWSPRRGFDHASSMREFSAAIAGRPNLNEAHHFLAMVLSHVGLLDEALLAFERSLAIYPGDEFTALHIGMVRLLQGRFEEGREITEATLSRPGSAWTYYQLAQCELRLGRRTRAEETLERLSREHAESVLSLTLRGLLAAIAGDASRALDLSRLVVRSRRSFGHYHHAQHDLACIHALLGNPAEALVQLRESVSDGFPCLPFFEADPLLENARRSAGWAPLHAELSARQEEFAQLYRSLRAGAAESGPGTP